MSVDNVIDMNLGFFSSHHLLREAMEMKSYYGSFSDGPKIAQAFPIAEK